MTGRLTVTEAGYTIEVYFEDGRPTHAASLESTGDLAIKELLLWEVGTFVFVPGERSSEQSVQGRIEMMLAEGAALSQQSQYLTKRGFKSSSYLTRMNANLTEQQFEQMVANGAAIDLQIQKYIYQLIDNRRNFEDILRIHQMAKAEWVPVMFNLLGGNLVAVSEKPSMEAKHASLEAMHIDPQLIEVAKNSLLMPDSGMLGFPLFLYFLEQEQARYGFSGAPYALLLFDIAVRRQKQFDPLVGESARPISEIVNAFKRSTDLLGHFRTFEFGVILPGTDAAAALTFANHLVNDVRASTAFGTESPADVAIAVGLATVPQDCQSLAHLLPAAEEAKRIARESGTPITTFKSLYK